jgi:hypothetical protein
MQLVGFLIATHHNQEGLSVEKILPLHSPQLLENFEPPIESGIAVDEALRWRSLCCPGFATQAVELCHRDVSLVFHCSLTVVRLGFQMGIGHVAGRHYMFGCVRDNDGPERTLPRSLCEDGRHTAVSLRVTAHVQRKSRLALYEELQSR